VLYMLVSSFAFSSPESWLSFGYEFGFYADEYKSQGVASETLIISDGLYISSYSFLTERVGIFAHGSFSFPRDIWVITNGGLSRMDLDNSPLNTSIGIIMGISFRVDFTEDFLSYFGLGFNIVSSMYMYDGLGLSYYGVDTTSLGFAGDIGLKLDMSDRFFLRIGSIINIDFARHRIEETYSGRNLIREVKGWDREFVMLGFRPYIGVGLNIHYRLVDGRYRMATGRSQR